MTKTIEREIEKAYNKLFYFVSEYDDIYDLVVEYKEASTGKSVRISWKDREEMLENKP